MLDSVFARLKRDPKGNIAIVFAFCAVPMVFLVGMAIDYTAAVYRQEELNSQADAAALAAVRPALMAKSDQESIAAAQSTFMAQASGVSGVTVDPRALSVTSSNSTANGSVKRSITVNYSANSQNSFMGLLGQPSITLSGSAQATATAAPNINFYLLLDDSPSMAIAATPNDIATMVANTSKQGGCAFACHQTNPGADNLGNSGGVDNYQLARSLKVTLRIDMLRQATQNLMTSAQQTSNVDNAQYQMAIYTFDYALNTIQTLTSSLSSAQSQATKIDVLTVYKNNWLTSSNNNSDADTNFTNAMTNINTVMPAPGNGSNASGDTPQEVLFIVTDGVDDAMINGSRKQRLFDTNNCTTVKNRGIRIAVLYTTYYPLPTNSWYTTYISPFQSQIGPTLQSCASPGLFFEVSTGGDISVAMNALFQKAVSTAYLSR
jgi:Flp pilus assembly protein TadG